MKRRWHEPQQELRGGDSRKPGFLRKAISCIASAALATMMIPVAAFANGGSQADNNTVHITLKPGETYAVSASTPYEDGGIEQDSLNIDTSIVSVSNYSSNAVTSDTPATSLTSGSSYKLQDQRNNTNDSDKRWLSSTIVNAGANNSSATYSWYKEGEAQPAEIFTINGSTSSGYSIKAEAASKFLNSSFEGIADTASYSVGNATLTNDENSSSFSIKPAGGSDDAYLISPASGECKDYRLASYCGQQRTLFLKDAVAQSAGAWWKFFETTYVTSFTLTAAQSGETSFVLAGKTYNITVADQNTVQDVYVGEGQTVTVDSDIDNGANNVSGVISKNDAGAEVEAISKLNADDTAATTIENGKSYLIQDLRDNDIAKPDHRYLTTSIVTATGNNHTSYSWYAESSKDNAELFTLEGSGESGWSIYGTNAKQYIDSALGEDKTGTDAYHGCDAKLSNARPNSSVITISPVSGSASIFNISAMANDQTYYLNSYCGDMRALFLGSDCDGANVGGRWSFYPASYKTTITATGKTAGTTTEVKVGATTYRIHTIPAVHVPLNAATTANASGTRVEVTGDVASYVSTSLDNGVVTLSNNGTNVPAVGETKTGYLEVDGKKVCAVEVSLDGEYSIAKGGSVELTADSGNVIIPSNANAVVNVNSAKGIADLVTDPSDIEAGKQYVIAGARIGRAMTGEMVEWTASNAAQGLKHNGSVLSYADENTTRLVTTGLNNARMTFVDAGNGKFKIRTTDGKWLKSNSNLKLELVSSESDATAFAVSKFNGQDASKYAGSLELGAGNLFVSDWGGSSSTSKGLTLTSTNPGAALYIYEVKDVVANVTGKAQGGPVYVSVGNKSYKITVGAAAASINGKSYTTVEAAAKAAKSGDTIEIADGATSTTSVAIPADVAVKYGTESFAPVSYKVNDSLTVKTKKADGESYLFLPSAVKSVDQTAFGTDNKTQFNINGAVQAGNKIDATLTWKPANGLTLTKSFKVMLSDNIKTLSLNGIGHDISWLNENKNNAATTGTAALIQADGSTTTAGISKLKGRGNTSWSANTDKKPYNLTLAKGEKLNLVGDDCNAERKWSLIANNTGDITGVCNDFAYELYQKIAGDAAVHCTPINLYVAGEYRGVYLAVDKVELGEKRVNITEPKYSEEGEGSGTQRIICEGYDSNFPEGDSHAGNIQWKYAKDHNPTEVGKKGDSTDPAINAGILAYSYKLGSELKPGKDGGILIEVAHQYTDENSWFVTNHGVMISLKEPDCATQAQVQRIAMYVQDFEDALYSNTGLNSKGKSVADYADLDSIAKTYILSAFTGQNDFLDCSDYFYVDFNGNGEVTSKMHAGPAWDYNSLAMGVSGLYLHKTDQTGYNGRQVWIEQLLKNGDFTAALYKLQSGEFAQALNDASQIVTNYNNLVRNSIAMDEVIWKYNNVTQNTWANSFAVSINNRIQTWANIWSDTANALRGVTLAENNGALVATATGATGYKWYKVEANDSTMGVEISGATASSYTPQEPGIYYVVVTGAALTGTQATTMRSNPVAFGTYEVKFDGNGQTINTPVQNVAYKGKAVKPEDPIVNGYTFGGWFKNKDCTEAWNFDTDTVDASITLYAKWTVNKYTVKFDANGHGTAPAAQTDVEYNTAIAVPTAPTASGYTFGGWFKDAACTAGQEWNFVTDKVTGDVTLYAKWTSNSTGGGYVPTPTPKPDPTPTPDPDTPDTPQAPAKGDFVVVGAGTGQLHFAVTNVADATGKGGTVAFTACNGNATSVNVPATVEINGVAYVVTEIAPYAFKNCKRLKKVTMAGSITKVGKGAFENCKSLKSVTIGTGVKSVGKSAFKGCKALTSVTVTSKHLSKKSVKGCLKGSAVKTVVVKVGSKKANKSYAKKYAKLFTKKVAGKKASVKASKKALKK